MPYDITYWSKPYLAITGKKTVRKETAAEAYEFVQRMQASDETVEVRSPSGHEVDWRELKVLAEREAH